MTDHTFDITALTPEEMNESATHVLNSFGTLTIGNFLPKQYNYEPHEDITAYELALILPVFSANHLHVSMMIEGLPPEARRHFREAG